MKSFYTAILLFSFATFSYAQNEVVIIGAGTKTCQEYMDFTKNANTTNEKTVADGMFISWTQGYLSGKNRQLIELGRKPVEIGNIAELDAMITFICGNAVKQGSGKKIILFTVMDKILEEQFSNTLKKK